MKMEHYIRAIAGTLIIITLILGQVHSRLWLVFTAFVGLNLLQSAYTRFCPMENILERIFKIQKQ